MKQNKLKTIKTGKFWGYDKIISTLKKTKTSIPGKFVDFLLEEEKQF